MNPLRFPVGLLTLTLTLALAATAARAVDLPAGDPKALGFSPERLHRIAEAVDRGIADQRITGMVTLVLRHGQVAWFDAQGLADREARTPMAKDTLFRICSMTKPITSTAVMMLYEEGKFTLEDPISKFLPEFKNPRVLVTPASGSPYTIPAKREITIADLLRHTSGLAYPWDPLVGRAYKDNDVATGLLQYDGTIADSVKHLAAQPLVFSPGEKWEYGLSIDVLGRLVEVVSGLPLDQFFQTRILGPLGMKDTSFYINADKLPRLAAVYTYYDGQGLQRFPSKPITEDAMVYSADYPYNGPKKLFSGGAGLCSTAMDYARFCQMILGHGKLGDVRILSRKSVELMSHDQLGAISPDLGFGLGFGVEGKPHLSELGTVGALQWAGFYYTSFEIDPAEDLIIISMAQLHPTGGFDLDARVKVLAYQALED
jgi:CubicO group peptidase (beta-lactamase class C family)